METSIKENRFQNNYLVQAWLGILLALIFGASLAGVQAALGPVIAENKVNETKLKVPELLLGQELAEQMRSRGEKLEIVARTQEVERGGIKKFYPVYEARHADGSLVGWVTKVSGQGYADRIELLLGLDAAAGKITGLFILDQKETPGLGNKITEPGWRNQFIAKATAPPLAVVKTGAKNANEIDAVTGATISSNSVVTIVNGAVGDLKQPLLKH